MFRFKQFEVIDDHCAMKVGTDGVLLGAWCGVDNARRILDVGTGCGLIALMLAQRAPQAMIQAIDIDHGSTTDAHTNFESSAWCDRLNLIEGDFLQMEQGQWDLIVSNPPFFSRSLLPPDATRAQARHDGSLTIDQLISHASRLLLPQGCLALVIPASELQVVVEASAFNSLNIKRITEVIMVEGKQPSRLLLELTPQPSATHRDTICLRHKDGQYTRQYQSLCADFYLHF